MYLTRTYLLLTMTALVLIRTSLLKIRTTPLSYIRTILRRRVLRLYLKCLQRYFIAYRTLQTPYTTVSLTDYDEPGQQDWPETNSTLQST